MLNAGGQLCLRNKFMLVYVCSMLHDSFYGILNMGNSVVVQSPLIIKVLYNNVLLIVGYSRTGKVSNDNIKLLQRGTWNYYSV